MNETLFALTTIALIAIAILIAVILIRLSSIARDRDAAMREAVDLRARFDAFAHGAAEHERDMRGDLATARKEQGDTAMALRKEVGDRLSELTNTVEQKLEAVRNESGKKLDEMRATVDEKLQATLEHRLGASFKIVSDRLEQVHRGLGEMQALAVGVGDLKRVLANVKTRGGWGEVQLEALLSDLLTSSQYAKNVQTHPESRERVEFAIRTPGQLSDGTPCWVPIDAKFPLQDWERLQEALERADIIAADAARKALRDFLRLQAKSIREKYIKPPYTTDFAILFLPTEALYAEMLSRAGFVDGLQREFRVVLTGPMTLAALLNSLQMGFRTLAIEQRSSEVWKILGQVKAEFSKFGDILARTRKKLEEATNTIDEARGKTTTIERRLKDVETLPEPEVAQLFDETLAPYTLPGLPDEK
jgi:DNA recombination protein RmuC